MKNDAKRRKYHLSVSTGDGYHGPTDDEIARAVASLPGGIPSSVVLKKAKAHFMQAAGGMEENFCLEYQEFSVDGHWEHEDSPEVPGSVVIQALQWYAADDERWRKIPWKRLPASEMWRRSAESKREAEAEEDDSDEPKGSVVLDGIKMFFKVFFHEIGKR